MPARRAHYVLSTHWDREWYQPFQDYRYRLVQLLDDVLAGLADRASCRARSPTDGQAIVLEDYLEVRPERARSGAPDAGPRGQTASSAPGTCCPTSSWCRASRSIRNLRLGREVARAYGGAALQRRLCVRHLWPQQPDAADSGRLWHARWLYLARRQRERPARYFAGAAPTAPSCPGLSLWAGGLLQLCQRGAHVLRAMSPRSTPTTSPSSWTTYLQTMRPSQTEVDSVLLFDGGDHQEWDRAAYQVLAERDWAAADGEFEIVHTALDEFAAEDAAAGRARSTTCSRASCASPGAGPAPLDSSGSSPACSPAGSGSSRPTPPARRCSASGPSRWARWLTHALGRGVSAGLSRRRLALAAPEPPARLDLRLQHRPGARGHEVPLQPVPADRRPPDHRSRARHRRQHRGAPCSRTSCAWSCSTRCRALWSKWSSS